MTDESQPDDEPDGELAGDELASQQPTEDAASIHTVRGKRERQLRANAETVLFWRDMLKTPVGRRVLWELLNGSCHIFEERFACGPNGFPQPEATWFHAGERAIGDRIYRTLLRNDLEGVRLMHEEYDPQFSRSKPIRKRSA